MLMSLIKAKRKLPMRSMVNPHQKPSKPFNMTNQVVFKVQLQGTFTHEGFTASSSAKTMTITKFADGTFVAKFGNKVFKDRFSTGYSFLTKSLSNLGINL